MAEMESLGVDRDEDGEAGRTRSQTAMCTAGFDT